jgi:Tetrapyrrole (Corrin/Porphyrin) Methylases
MTQRSTIVLCFLSSVAFSGIAVTQPTQATGKFYIVGMGTAPDLITVRAQRVIGRADIVLTERDRKAAGPILSAARNSGLGRTRSEDITGSIPRR